MLYLKRLSFTDGEDIYQMLQEILPDDNGFHNKAYGMTYEQYRIWLQNEYEVDNGKLEDWMVPQSSYWLYEDDIPVGYGRIRHYLNDFLKENSGHIGYAIRKSMRGIGYGKKLLELLVKECAELGIESIQLSANIDNVASNKAIKYNGAILIRSTLQKNFYIIKAKKTD